MIHGCRREQIHSLRGHSSTIRCLKVLDGRPVAISGSRDWSLRVWDIERGLLLQTLIGHEQSVRCIETAGNQVVSGSYDYTCRVRCFPCQLEQKLTRFRCGMRIQVNVFMFYVGITTRYTRLLSTERG